MLDFRDIKVNLNETEYTLEQLLQANRSYNEIMNSLSRNITTNLFLFFIALRNSLLLENFLIYSNKQFKDYVKEILFVQKAYAQEEFYMDYNPQSKSIVITLDTKIISQFSEVIVYHHPYLKSNYPEEAFSRDTQNLLKLLYTPILPIRDNEAAINALAKFRARMNFSIILAQLKEFQELPNSIKERILNQEFTNRNNLGNLEEEELQKIIKQISETYQKSIVRKYESEIADIDSRITDYQLELNSLLKKRNLKVTEYLVSQTEELKPLAIEKLPKQIASLKQVNQSIILTTIPIILDLDRTKTNTIHPISIRQLIEQNCRICIGIHEIEIKKDLTLEFRPLSGLLNFHVESYRCYGTFQEHITAAQRAGDLNKLIHLATRLLSSATIGDPAGTRTITEGLVIDSSGYIKYANNKAIIGQHYLDYLQGGTLNEYNRTVL